MSNPTSEQHTQIAIVVDDVFGQLLAALQTSPDDQAYETGVAALEELQTRIFQVLDDAREIVAVLVEQRNEAVQTANAALDRQAELEDDLSITSADLQSLQEALEHWEISDHEQIRDMRQSLIEDVTEEMEGYAIEYAFEVTNENMREAVLSITGCSYMEALQVTSLFDDQFEGPVDARTLELVKQIVAHLEKNKAEE